MPASRTIPVRLTEAEIAALDAIRCSDVAGDRNRTEMIRFLILREFRRRKTRSSVVASADYASDFRTGRPKRPRMPVQLPQTEVA